MTFEHSLGCGARGFLVERLQGALQLDADGIFGNRTQSALATLQERAGRPAYGRAGAEDFQELGLAWPTDFERSMNMVSQFEGTGFGDCNSSDIDGAGLTMGIAGFTSGHGEVQELLRRYFQLAPNAISRHLPPDSVRELIHVMSRPQSDIRVWKQLFFADTERVMSWWLQAFAAWGRDVAMQKLQLEYAYERFWLSAVRCANKYLLESLLAKCLFLDIAIQNGGWRQTHAQVASRSAKWKTGAQAERLMIVAKTVAAGARPGWRSDVLSRKQTIACGRGTVHGRYYNLTDYGLCIPP